MTIKKIKITKLILFFSYIALIIIGTACIFIVSVNYQQIYGTPRNINKTVDFKGYGEVSELLLDPNLSGEWEFFYNRWIVTDGYDGEADGTITLPGRWTGMEINGEKLPKTGYASYRLTIVNLKDVQNIFVHFSSLNIAYRTFINGKLTVECGEMAKDAKDAKAGHTYKITEPYFPENGEDLIIVIEISGNTQGGLLYSPLLFVRDDLKSVDIYDFLVFTLPLLLVGVMFAAFLFCAFVPVRTLKSENRFAFSTFILMLFLHYLTTKDAAILTVDLLRLNGMLLPVLRYITGVILAVVYIVYLYSVKAIVFNKTEAIMVSSVNTLAIAAYFLLGGSVFQIVPIAVSLLTLLWVSYKLTVNDTKFGYFSAFLSINLFVFTALFYEAIDSQGLITFGFETFFSIGLFIILAAVIFFNFYKARENEKALLKTAQLDAEIANMKRQSLKAQIKPHFVFNSLSSIQDVYRRDAKEGEEMLSRFAAHLRANVDSDDKDLIPFEDELRNMINYFELENLRHEKKLNLILNTEYMDFFVPILSLQPLLENAVKYAGTQDIDNGYIQISSGLAADGSVIIEVLDNGRGFDTDKIRADAVGIKNATERLKYGLNADLAVKSETGRGTTVTITIPKIKGKEDIL